MSIPGPPLEQEVEHLAEQCAILLRENEQMLAENKRLCSALQTIDDGAQCDWCADIARKALEEKT